MPLVPNITANLRNFIGESDHDDNTLWFAFEPVAANAGVPKWPPSFHGFDLDYVMDQLVDLHKIAKDSYDKYDSDVGDRVGDVGRHAVAKLMSETRINYLSTLHEKRYSEFACVDGVCRPFLAGAFIQDALDFRKRWEAMLAAREPENERINLPSNEINSVLYTAIAAFSACYDIWKPKSRKTPGTFLEILLGCVLEGILPKHRRTKFVPIPGQSESVSTDIVFSTEDPEESALVIPAKITTRERIVQPYAHQRILDGVFGEGKFKSVLMCVSEIQRKTDNTANEICVPGTIRLFQSHLASLDGIIYFDPPHRYLQSDVTDIVHVGTIGDFLASGLSESLKA